MEFLLNKNAIVSSVSQDDVLNWLIDRYGLITGTKYFGIICSKTREQKELHAKKICGIIKDEIPVEHMAKVQYGLDNEDRVREYLEKKLEQKIYELGVVRESVDSIFACSIDGILSNGDIVELKTTEKPIPTDYKSDYSEIPYSYMWQMTHNCVCTGAKGCHYLAYHRNEDMYYYRYVPLQQHIWDDISIKAINFYLEYIHPIYDLVTRKVREVHLKVNFKPIQSKHFKERNKKHNVDVGGNGGRGNGGNGGSKGDSEGKEEWVKVNRNRTIGHGYYGVNN